MRAILYFHLIFSFFPAETSSDRLSAANHCSSTVAAFICNFNLQTTASSIVIIHLLPPSKASSSKTSPLPPPPW
nr:hypothetical protein Iba_chr14aCG5320 [Ipomoea batatas]